MSENTEDFNIKKFILMVVEDIKELITNTFKIDICYIIEHDHYCGIHFYFKSNIHFIDINLLNSTGHKEFDIEFYNRKHKIVRRISLYNPNYKQIIIDNFKHIDGEKLI